MAREKAGGSFHFSVDCLQKFEKIKAYKETASHGEKILNYLRVSPLQVLGAVTRLTVNRAFAHN